MTSSAAISRDLEEDLVRSVRRDRRRSSAGIGSLAAALVIVFAMAGQLGFDVANARAETECAAERDAMGFGRSAVLRAMDTPDAPSAARRFLYRVARDEQSYTVTVVTRAGAYVGDTWQRDALGRVRHVFDVCKGSR